MRELDVAIIGNGVMGKTIAASLRQKGRDVEIFDSHDPFAGTNPSGGSIKPSVFTGLDTQAYTKSLEALDLAFGLEEMRMAVRPSGDFLKLDIRQVNLERLLESVLRRTVILIEDRLTFPILKDVTGESYRCQLLVVAAGMGCSALFPEIFPGPDSLYAKQGVSFRFQGTIEQPFVQAWAPYKQITVHNVRHQGALEIWAGDGTAIIPKNWRADHKTKSLERVQGALNSSHAPRAVILGYRSFHVSKAKPCFLEKPYPRIWVATGAGKFGGIAAGWAARKIANVS